MTCSEPQIVTQARVAIDILNRLAGLDGALPLLLDLLSTTALMQNRELDKYGFIAYSVDAGDRPSFWWWPREALP